MTTNPENDWQPGAIEVIANCIEHDYNRTFHDTAICILADLRRAGFAVVHVPEIAFKGPHDTNGTMLITAAEKAESARYPVGGSNVGRAVAQVLREVAAAADSAT